MKSRNIIGALIVGISLVAAPAAQAEWIPVQDNYSFNTEHIGVNGPRRTVFVRLDKPGVQDGKKYEYMVTRQEVDCTNWTIDLRSIAKYDRNGKVVDSVEAPPGYYHPVQVYPETNGDILAKRVCAIPS